MLLPVANKQVEETRKYEDEPKLRQRLSFLWEFQLITRREVEATHQKSFQINALDDDNA